MEKMVNILFGSTYEKMLVDHELTPMSKPFYGFSGNSIILWRRITLAVEMGAFLLVDYHFMEFLVVDHLSAYHGVLGRPVLKELWPVTSIHHLCMKFSSKHGIATVLGNQMGSRECYLNSLPKAEPRNMIIMNIELFDLPEEGLTPK